MESKNKTNRLTKILADTILRIIRWRIEVIAPPCEKYVLIGAPHTSNFDFFFMLLMVYSTGLKLNWVGKHTLFRKPFSGWMRMLGGIPVDRRTQNQFVQQMVDSFNQSDQLKLAIAPEGTRGKSQYWRTGFYHIAHGARVPIVFGYIDYKQKIVGIGPSMIPGGDINKDFPQIREFYRTKSGRRPELQGEILIRPLENNLTP